MTTIQECYELKSYPPITRSTEIFPIVNRTGVELELEFNANRFRETLLNRLENSKYWTFTSDGSLRGASTELILKHPASPVYLSRALPQLNKALIGIPIENSYRTGTHVHVNVLDRSLEDVRKISIWAKVLESYLASIADPYRLYNCFCGRTLSTETFNDLNIFSNNYLSLAGIPRLEEKYHGVNFSTIPTIGTIEFRIFPGISKREDLLTKVPTWINWCQHIWRWAQTQRIEEMKTLEYWERWLSNPREILNQLRWRHIEGGDESYLVKGIIWVMESLSVHLETR